MTASGRAVRGRAAWVASLGFELDDFQVRALDAIDAGRSVLVAAPTGSGKTVVGEYAVERALIEGNKAFYTTPLKALSNQKFGDLVQRYGNERVGLLTGDNSINGDAPLKDIVGLVRKHRIKHLPVVDDEHVVGMVSRADILQAFVNFARAAKPQPEEAVYAATVRDDLSLQPGA